ncbi:hypothetical protein CVD25_19395 [Bacillus canaveralius]|uniref:DUF2726 domain-containing protein n=1 Tax=Bacillus canaveralius TaxID=1403243 RepID=A0A2N5GLM8_9BACI|nr:DUF2726 domain-containing protein [Bacillus canaveralius]PLR82612.1 hypothetical protein CU635_11260 [Bacillus canaveralius]PLR91261.1 hypothetical protein CVD25_19395 [Bacillus canaveralius]
MEETLPLIETYNTKLTESFNKYREINDPSCLKNTIEETIVNITIIDKSSIKNEAMEEFIELVERMVYFSLEIKEFALGDSIYQKIIPNLASSFFQEKDVEKKERIWLSSECLITNYFSIQHYLKGLSEEQVQSLGHVLKWFKSFSGLGYTDEASFIDILIDTHYQWKETMTPEEETTFWITLAKWLIREFLMENPNNLSLYQKVKIFYTNYKKSKRLTHLGYLVIQYVSLIIGVAENKIEFSKLVDKCSYILNQMNKTFCEAHGSALAKVFSDITMMWTPTPSDRSLFTKLLYESTSPAYKKGYFNDIFYIDISKWFENNAYSLLALAYQQGLFSENEVKENLFELAYSLKNENQHAEARRLYEALLIEKPNHDSALNNLAVIYRDVDKNYEKALAYFEQAATLNPSEEIYKNNLRKTKEIIKREKEKPKRQIDNYFKQTDKQQKSICFTLYKLEDFDKVTTEDIENISSFKGNYLQKHLDHLQRMELIYYHDDKGWRLEEPIREKVASYVDPKLERQIIRNNQAIMYRPIFYHESEINLYRVLLELFPQHFVFPNMDLKTIIQVEKIRDYISSDLLDYLFKAHVDFAIIDTTSYLPILTFEKDSEYQDTEPQKSNAVKKNAIFQASGLPLIRIRYSSAMDYERLKEEIKQATKEYILEISGSADAEARRILASIDPKRFGILTDLPSNDELKEAWEKLVGNVIAAHTTSLELDQEHCVLRVTVEESFRTVLELGADSIKSNLYQLYPILNAVQFYWANTNK